MQFHAVPRRSATISNILLLIHIWAWIVHALHPIQS
jgi:hypothetical protein